MTERLHFHFPLSCIGEGNGNPLQCSCQENPRDTEAWKAAVHGVAQSRTLPRDFPFTFHFHALEKEMVLLSLPLLPSFPLSLLPLFIHSFLFAFGLRNLTFTSAAAAAAAAKSLQSCLTLCDPRDGSPPGSLVFCWLDRVPGILQARTLEWVAISFSNA